MTDPLRATDWSEFVGQDHLKERLDVHIRAAVLNESPLSHVLLSGPPGFGKTTLSSIIAHQLKDPFLSLTMPVKPVVLASMLRQFEGGVLFLDEVHRATKSQQEDLLNLLEDGFLQCANGRRVHVKWLTVIAATTEPEKVIPALFDRFPIRPQFDPYTPVEMACIVGLMATKIGLDLEDDVIDGLASAAGGVPRNARQLVLAARDLSLVERRSVETSDVLSLCRVDPNGLTQAHTDYLNIVRSLGGQAGLDLISTMLRLHPSVIRDLERLLVARDLLMYGDRGRELTELGWAYGRQQAKSPRRARG